MTLITKEIYDDCKTKTFGNKDKMDWGNRRVPKLEEVNLILSVTGPGGGVYGPEDLAVVWAIETNFMQHPPNRGNLRAGEVVSVDIGPVQINYPQWLGPGMSPTLRAKVLGTNLKHGQTFNGDPKANLSYAWKYCIPKLGGPVRYNANSPARPIAVAALKPKLKRFFACMLEAVSKKGLKGT